MGQSGIRPSSSPRHHHISSSLDIESEDARRIAWKPPKPYFAMLDQKYEPKVFENTPSVFGIDLAKPGYVPNDWLYIYPRITVYRRR
jgi:hypothetical protein